MCNVCIQRLYGRAIQVRIGPEKKISLIKLKFDEHGRRNGKQQQQQQIKSKMCSYFPFGFFFFIFILFHLANNIGKVRCFYMLFYRKHLSFFKIR